MSTQFSLSHSINLSIIIIIIIIIISIIIINLSLLLAPMKTGPTLQTISFNWVKVYAFLNTEHLELFKTH